MLRNSFLLKSASHLKIYNFAKDFCHCGKLDFIVHIFT